MPDIKEVFEGFLSKTLNIDATGAAELYNSDGTVKDDTLTSLLQKDADRVKSLKPDTTKLANEQYKKGVREAMEKFESEFKDETGFSSEKRGVELVLEYAASIKSKAGDGKTLTDDDVKRHPAYIAMADKLKKEKEEAVGVVKKELDDFKSDLTKKETFSKVSSKAEALFDSLKPILSKDPVKAKRQKEDFINKLKGYEYEIQGDRIVVLKDGKALEDDHGHAVAFDKIVKETAEQYYDFQVTDDRSGTGNGTDKDKNPDGTLKRKIEVKVPQNEKEYIAALTDPKTSVEEKTAIKEAYALKQNGQEAKV